jgi:hypothetical protein
MVISRERKIITRVFVRRVPMATSGDLKGRHKDWFVAKKISFCDETFCHKNPLPMW